MTQRTSLEKPERSQAAKTLRQRAEDVLRAEPSVAPTMPTADVQALVHELNVHQMELEIQNEELRQAQVELSESRDRFSDLYEFAPVGYVTLDAEGNILAANLAAATMLVVERQKLLGTNISKFVMRHSQDECYFHRQSVFSSDTKQIAELEMHTADGTPLVLRLESIAFETEDGRRCRTALIDVTGARHAQQQLEESQQRYRRLTEAVTDYIYRVRVENGRAVETVHGANCKAVTGYTPEEFAENPMLWIAMVSPEDRAAVERQAACILSGQDAPPIEHRIRRKDSQLRWVLNTVSPQHDDRGHLIAYDGLLRDITERKQAEEALRQLNEELEQRVDARTIDLRRRTDQLARQSEELAASNEQLHASQQRLKLAHEAGRMGTWDWDVTVNYGVCDEMYHRLHGRSPEDHINSYETWMTCIHRDDRPRVAGEFDRLFSGGGDWLDVEYRVLWPDNSVRWLVGRGRASRDQSGRATRVIGVNFDITERRQAEESLRESESQLKAEAVALVKLNEASARLWPAQNLREGLDEILAATIDMLGADMGNVQLLDADHRVLVIAAQRGFRREFLDFFGKVSAEDDSACGRALRSGERIVIEDVEADAAYAPYRAIARAAGYRAVQSTPLISSEGIALGVFSAHWRPPHRPSEHELRRLDLYARQAAGFIQRCKTDETLRDREERLRAILNTAADAIITIDHGGTINMVNPATQQMFGYTQDELIGQNVKILMPPPYCDEQDDYVARYLETGEARIIGIGREVAGRHKDGSTFPVGLAVSEIGQLNMFTGNIRDISAVKELQKQVLEIAAEEDRKIGQELHDNIQQQLTGLGLLAKTVAERLEAVHEQDARLYEKAGLQQTSDTLTRVADGINESAKQVHLLSRGLIPVDVDAEGLRSALTDLASRIDEQYGVHCDFRCEGPVAVSDNFVATHLYRIAQEAVTNAVKHGRANQIEISLSGVNDNITLKVLDNGIGIDDKGGFGPGMGLRIMQYRAGLIGATVRIEPGEGIGTQVSCTVLRGGG